MKASTRTSNTSQTFHAGRSFAVGVLTFLLFWGQVQPAWATPAQVPLLTRSATSAQPNVVFTFDDSGSMAWRFMPDSTGISTDTNVRWSTTFHPADASTFGNGTANPLRVIAARPNDSNGKATDLISARMRSSAYNTLYYNPEIRYEPWYNSDGSQYPASPPATAWLSPNNRTTGNSVDLVGLKTFADSTTWCRSEIDNDPNLTESGDRDRTTVTCGTIPPDTFAFDSASCSIAGGSWGSSRCTFTSAQGATSGNCSASYGGTWTSSGGGQCRVTSMTQNYCGLRVGGTWRSSDSTCQKAVEQLAPAVYYTYSGGGLNTATNYSRVRIMDLPATGIVRGAGRTDCSAGGCTRDQEYQNFANWFTYYRTRNYLAIAASSKAFSEQGEDLRIGYGRINQGSSSIDGGDTKTLQRGVRTFAGTDRTSFFSWLHAVPASGGTPLRRAMDDIGKYYQRSSNAGPWGNTPGTDDGGAEDSQLQCRKSYHILMTDGYWNGDAAAQATGNVDNTNGSNITGPSGNSYQYIKSRPYLDTSSNTLADASMYYWNRDLRTDLPNRVPPDSKNPAFWQHMVNFTVGLGVNGTLVFPTDLAALQTGAKNWPAPGNDKPENIDDLWHAAVNSRGEYLSAKDPEQFANSLSSILQEIVVRNASEGGVAAAAATLQAGNRKYVPEYRTAVWTGNLTAYELDDVGQQGVSVWNAESSLPAHAARNIFAGTRNGSPKALPFTWAGLNAALKAELVSGSENLVNYLRGDASLEGGAFRERSGRLGDFVNSQPVFIKGLVDLQYNFLPASTAGRDSYRGFVTTKKAREGVIFVGGNDGMLHSFRDSDGRETFAFIPRILLPGLSALSSPSYGHRYYVDGQLTESDAYIGSAWKNVLVGSTGAGARGIFALDVTTTSSMGAGNVMWELDSTVESELGYVLAPIEVGLLKDGTWAAVFGNGYDSASGTAQLFIVNLQTGAVIKTIQASTATGNGLGGARVIRDANRVIVGVYAGDLKGNVWKFDLASTNPANWNVSFSGQPLFNAGATRPITAPPQYVTHPNGGYMVLVGTGKLFEEGDQTVADQQSLYGLWDKQSLTKSGTVWSWSTATRILATDTIVAQSFDATTVSGAGGATYYTITSQPLDWSLHRGWKLPLTITSGHRNLLSPQFVFGYTLFETMAPSAEGVVNPCDTTSNGVSYNLLINPLNGSMPSSSLFDVDGDGIVDPTEDQIVGGVRGSWDGRDVVLSQKPCVTPSDCPTDPDDPGRCPKGTKLISIQGASSGNTNVCVPIPVPERWWWRQLQQIPQ